MRKLSIQGQIVYLFEPASGSARRSVLFSHATGIAALSYTHIFNAWAEELQVNVFAYDVAGHGECPQCAVEPSAGRLNQLPAALCDQLKSLFENLSMRYPSEWTLAGHSLGAWLSLYTARDLDVRHLILLDIPLLPVTSALIWAGACLFNKRKIHPLARAARRRKKTFTNFEQALKAFKRNHFFRGWKPEHIENYIEANFTTQPDGKLTLKHDPNWEADLFESQPQLHTPLFLQMGLRQRNELKIDLIAGEQSQVCHSSS
ncbi:MAG: hypothetical protein RJB13_2568, partial [Pseudomonadota bacterium]